MNLTASEVSATGLGSERDETATQTHTEFDSKHPKDDKYERLPGDKGKKRRSRRDSKDGKHGRDDSVDEELRNENKLTVKEFFQILFCSPFLIQCPKDTWKYRSIYGSIIVYTFDMITDINITMLWIRQAYKQQNDISDYALNMTTHAILATFVIIFHRIMSAWTLYSAESMCAALLSFLLFLLLFLLLCLRCVRVPWI